MRFVFTITACILAFGLVSCGEPSGEYLPPAEVSQEYIPPAVEEPAPAATLGDDGYRYKAVRRVKYRHRRDVSNEYLPPTEEVSQEYLPPAQGPVAEPEPAHTLGNDGYRYKAVKRLRFRHRRDVSELSNEYLPPTQGPVEEPLPAPVAEPEPAHTLGGDGYRYKAVKRYRFRHRRDVSELNNDYLPPTNDVSQEYLPPAQGPVAEPEPAHTVGNDGYRYKAVKRLRFRHRRDVSNEYLPPTEGPVEEPLPAPVAEPEPAHTLGGDGYRYKAVKRYRFRHRRDVSELNNDYLPPTNDVSQEYLPPAQGPVAEPEPAHTVGNDGYRYKAVKRLRFRHRRDVSNEYLPPTEGPVEEPLPAPVAEPEPAHTLGGDGYRYKAVKRYRFRHRRDVSNEYLPPTEDVSQEYLPPAQGPVAEPEPAHTVGADGYRYKAVKRYRFRHRRDVSNEYLPPTEEVSQEYLPPAQGPVAEPEPAHTVGADGYKYKTVRRRVFRRRH